MELGALRHAMGRLRLRSRAGQLALRFADWRAAAGQRRLVSLHLQERYIARVLRTWRQSVPSWQLTRTNKLSALAFYTSRTLPQANFISRCDDPNICIAFLCSAAPAEQ